MTSNTGINKLCKLLDSQQIEKNLIEDEFTLDNLHLLEESDLREYGLSRAKARETINTINIFNDVYIILRKRSKNGKIERNKVINWCGNVTDKNNKKENRYKVTILGVLDETNDRDTIFISEIVTQMILRMSDTIEDMAEKFVKLRINNSSNQTSSSNSRASSSKSRASSSKSRSTRRKCKDCAGEGSYNCYSCNGGRINCISCFGRGKGQTYMGKINCLVCHGSGSKQCYVCHGTSKVECEECDGRGSC